MTKIKSKTGSRKVNKGVNKKANKHAKLGDIVEVIWLDAMGEQGKSLDELRHLSPGEMLVKTISYGILYKEDEKAIFIQHETNWDDCTYTVVPKDWITKIRRLKYAN